MSKTIYILSSSGELYHCNTDTPSNILCHHGIKGMKWGVRRYQNKDGSLTPAGKKRYRDAFDSKGGWTDKKIATQNEMYSRIRSSKEHAQAIDAISKTGWMKREKYIDDVLSDPNNPMYKATYKKTIKDLRAKGDPNDKRTDAELEEEWNHHFWEEMSDNLAKHYYDKVAPGRSEKADYAEWKSAMDNYIASTSDKMMGTRPTWNFEANMWDVILDDAMKQLRW